jgi:hypothetical protein
MERRTKMSDDVLDNCRRCGTPLLGDERLEDLCPCCQAEDPTDDRAAADHHADGDLRWFLVRWEIDLEANSAAEAARVALAIQRDPASTATFFIVRPHDDPDAEVELDLLDRSQP